MITCGCTCSPEYLLSADAFTKNSLNVVHRYIENMQYLISRLYELNVKRIIFLRKHSATCKYTCQFVFKFDFVIFVSRWSSLHTITWKEIKRKHTDDVIFFSMACFSFVWGIWQYACLTFRLFLTMVSLNCSFHEKYPFFGPL